jgi:2,3-bisphosphoglycerate-dependent phosphoglycerate mutase
MSKDKYLNIYVLIHTETYYNEKRLFSGHIDSMLTDRGHKQAMSLAKELADKKIDTAYISPLKRTKQTLKHILIYHNNVKIITDKRIVERDYGKLSRKSKVKYRKENPDLYPVYHRSYDIPPPGGESMKEVENRVLSFIKDVIKDMKEENHNVLIIAHSNSVRPIIRYFEKLTVDQMMQLENYRLKIFNYKVKI